MEEFIKYFIIFAIIAAILFWRVKLIYICREGSVLKLRTCFITLTLVDTKAKKKPKKKDYTDSAIAKKRKKAEKALEKKKKKAEAKKAAKEAKKEAKKKAKEAAKNGNAENTEETPKKKKKFAFKFPDDVEKVFDALSTLFGELLYPIIKNARIKFESFVLTVACPDPADTAVRYGIISQSVAYFLDILANSARLSDKEIGKVVLGYDFLSEKTTLDLEMSVTFSVWKLLYVILRGLVKLLMKALKFRVKEKPDPSQEKNKKHKIC